MKLFITTHFNPNVQNTAGSIDSLLTSVGIEPYNFVIAYPEPFSTSKQLMQTAKTEISNCDALLFDATEKSTGRAIEIGIAYTLGKKIIVIAKKGTEIRDTLAGVADLIVEYDQIEDIIDPLTNFLLQVKST
jgi:2'-deoxynucleoside 5'-phosphate N-hydrolase